MSMVIMRIFEVALMNSSFDLLVMVLYGSLQDHQVVDAVKVDVKLIMQPNQFVMPGTKRIHHRKSCVKRLLMKHQSQMRGMIKTRNWLNPPNTVKIQDLQFLAMRTCQLSKHQDQI